MSLAAAADPVQAASVPHATLDSLLQRHVREERVDYLTLRDEDGARLDAHLSRLAAVDAASLGAAERLAFEIDLYNATMLRAVCDRYREGWTPAADDFAVFKAPLVRLRTGVISLDDLEHRVIRPRVKDARVHVALVCAARSCPPIQPRAWVGVDLESQLDRRMRAFVTDTLRNRIDRSAGRLRLSRLFEWFAEDFGGASAVADYVSRWTERTVDALQVSFLDYDWSLNLARPRAGLWRTVAAQQAAVHPGASGAPGPRSLSRGEVVRELGLRGARVRVVLPGGGEGWIERTALRPWRAPR